MSRPEVSIVMPFGGHPGAAASAIEALHALDAGPGDELILADNAGVVPPGVGFRPSEDVEEGELPEVIVVPVPGERSPAHARNVGAGRASREWILFLDADCRPLGRLLEDYFRRPIDADVGALAGGLVAASGGEGLVARYGESRNFLSAEAHLQHPFLPRAAAANLLVRRAAFEQVGGFYEGIRAAEDTDFTWRLQRAGWKLDAAPRARVEHSYRSSLADLRRQWRGYAAGRAWLGRRYEGFTPEPALVRGLDRVRHRITGGLRRRSGGDGHPGAAKRGPFLALDALLALEELAGFTLSNRPDVQNAGSAPVEVVLVADRFPGRGDPLVELAEAVGHARVEAAARPEVPDLGAGRHLDVRYLEDHGFAARLLAGLRVLIRHPVLVSQDLLGAGAGDPSTWTLAPAVLRLAREPHARVHPLGGGTARTVAARIARLAGRQLEE